MQIIEPTIYHVAQTSLDNEGVQAYMNAVGVPDWTSDAPSDAEKLVEIGGRSCYRSFEPGLNKNVTKVREGNAPYLRNILDQKHGSVIEHAYDTYVFWNVSRVFTHELVRHRISNFSQESLRYVRLDALRCYWPKAFDEHPRRSELLAEWSASFKEDEDRQVRIATILDLDNLPMSSKKKLTSSMRRMAPDGLATMIMYTTNHRNYRAVIEQRTDAGAEEEIRLVFERVYRQQRARYPNLYADAREEMVDGFTKVTFANYKI